MCILTTQRRKGSLDGGRGAEGRVNLKLQEAEATKIKILGWEWALLWTLLLWMRDKDIPFV